MPITDPAEQPTPEQPRLPRPRPRPSPLTGKQAAWVVGGIFLLFGLVYAPRLFRALTVPPVQQPPVAVAATPTATTGPRVIPTLTADEEAYERAYYDWDWNVQAGYGYWMTAAPLMRRTMERVTEYREAVRYWTDACDSMDTRPVPARYVEVGPVVVQICSELDGALTSAESALQEQNAGFLTKAQGHVDRAYDLLPHAADLHYEAAYGTP